MIKGCKKNVVYLKNTDSKLFDEAYFILNDKYAEKVSRTDILSEANRLIAQTPVSSYFGMIYEKNGKNTQNSKKSSILFSALWFLLGALTFALMSLFISFI